MRKVSLSLDAMIAALAVLGVAACNGKGRIVTDRPTPAPQGSKAVPVVTATAIETLPTPPASPPAATAAPAPRPPSSPAKKPSSASCGAGGCSPDMKKPH